MSKKTWMRRLVLSLAAGAVAAGAWVMTARAQDDGSGERRLTSSGVVTSSRPLRFDATGSYVVYGISKQAETALYVVSVAGGPSQKIADFLIDPGYGF